MTARRRVREMLGEMLREVATLVVVFVPLDASVRNTLTPRVMIGTVVFSGALFTAGVLLEICRKQRTS